MEVQLAGSRGKQTGLEASDAPRQTHPSSVSWSCCTAHEHRESRGRWFEEITEKLPSNWVFFSSSTSSHQRGKKNLAATPPSSTLTVHRSPGLGLRRLETLLPAGIHQNGSTLFPPLHFFALFHTSLRKRWSTQLPRRRTINLRAVGRRDGEAVVARLEFATNCSFRDPHSIQPFFSLPTPLPSDTSPRTHLGVICREGFTYDGSLVR